MLKNYLKIAWRNLKRRPGYTFINVFGLAVGLAACLVIGLYVRFELSYDEFFPNAEHTYRVVTHKKDGNGSARSSPGLAKALASRFPEIEHATVVSPLGEVLLGAQGNRFYIERVHQADSIFFDIFPYELLRGNPNSALAGPKKIVITQSVAKKTFEDKNPIGKIISYENRDNYIVTGVMEDPPKNAHFRPNALLSLSEYRSQKRRYINKVMWKVAIGYTYITLKEDSDPKALEQKINAFSVSQAPDYFKDHNLALQPVTDIHLYSDLYGDITPQSDIKFLYLFSAIGVLLLIIACINYINLSTARASQRNKEVCIRKVVGGTRGQLVRQFLSESLLIILIALPITLLLAKNALPLIHQITGLELSLWMGFNINEWLILIAILLLVGIFAGLYPALYLSGFQPSRIFGGKLVKGRTRKTGLHKGLVIFQFAASIALIIATLIVQSQLEYIQQKDLGFDEEHVVTFNAHHLDKNYSAFKQELLQQPDIHSVTSGPVPGLGKQSIVFFMNEKDSTNNKEGDSLIPLYFLRVDYDYVETLKLDIKAGSDFSRKYAIGDGRPVILNTEAMELYGLDRSTFGSTVKITEAFDTGMRLIGTFEGFHNSSLYETIPPTVIMLNPGRNFTVLVRLASENLETGLASIKDTWTQFLPNRPFQFAFLKDQIQAQYQTGQRLGHIFGLFAVLAILVACLGLFGLAAFTAQRRTKEIGIRKVMGATVTNIVGLLSKDFIKLVLIGFVIAVPVAWYFMNRWLQDFAYRIEIGPGIFMLAGALAVLIALATVSWQSIRAALANPVDSLRSE